MTVFHDSALDDQDARPRFWLSLVAHEDARQVRSRLVTRGGPRDAADRLDEGAGGNHHHARVADLGQLRELVGGQRAQVEARRAGHHLDVALRRAVLERQVVLRQGADHFKQEPARKHDSALALDRGLGGHPDAELHVGGLQLDPTGGRFEADAGEGLNGAAGRYTASGHTEAAYELFS